MNIAMLLQMAAEAMPERVALGVSGQEWNYAGLWSAAQAAAQQIRASDCTHVALLDTGSAAVPLALFGAALAGVPYVPINYRLTAAGIDALLARVSPALLVGDPAHIARHADDVSIRGIASSDFVARCVAGAPGPVTEIDMDPERVAVQLFTSGTTGTPKAALLRHRNLVAYILGSVEFAGAAAHEASLVSVPPYHIAGIAAFLSAVYAGRRIVLLPGFDPAEWLRVCAEQNISNAFVAPTMLVRIVECLRARGQERAGLPGLRAIAYGGGRMPASVIETALALFPDVDFTNAYGLTETSSTITVLGPREHRAALGSTDPAVRRRLGSVGVALPGVEVAIRAADGRTLGPEQPGEIFVRGEQVAGEYEGLGSTLDADGWFATRDAGWLDAEGYLFLDGRADDVIVRGGENISPGEVEDLLLTHPAVQDAAVFALASEQWGEAVAAAVVCRAGCTVNTRELQELVRARLRSSRVPERIEFLAELPYNEMGKLLRRELRRQFGSAGA